MVCVPLPGTECGPGVGVGSRLQIHLCRAVSECSYERRTTSCMASGMHIDPRTVESNRNFVASLAARSWAGSSPPTPARVKDVRIEGYSRIYWTRPARSRLASPHGPGAPHNRCRGIVNGRAKTIACAHVLGISTLSFPLDAHWQCARPGLQGETPPQTHRLVRPWIAASVSRSIAYWVMPSPIQFVFSMFSTPAPRAHTSAWLAPANIPVIPGTNSESFASTMEACATLRACLNLIPVLFLFYGSCNVSAINQDTVQRRRGTSSDNHWHQRLTHRNFDEGSERCAHMVAVRSEWSPSCAFAIHSIPMWGVRPYRAGPGTVVRGSQPMREAERLRFRLRSPRRPLDRVCVRVAQEGQCVPRLAVWPIVSATCREFPVFDRPA